MDDNRLISLRSSQYDELAGDPKTLKVMLRMMTAKSALGLVRCIFPDVDTEAYRDLLDNPKYKSTKSFSQTISDALNEASKVGFPLCALPEGLTRAIEDSVGGRLRGADTTSYDRVVAGLSPPQHTMVLPSDPSRWPQSIGPIEFVYADGNDSNEGKEELQGLEYYTGLLRQLVSQRDVSVRRSRTPRAGIAPFVCVLDDASDTFKVSEGKQELLQALSRCRTTAEFYLTLLREDQSPDSVPIVNYLVDELRSKSLSERIEAKLVSQLSDLWGCPSEIDPSLVGTQDLKPKDIKDMNDESSAGYDSEQGSEEEYETESEEADSEIDGTAGDRPEEFPSAFSANGRLRHETMRWPPGGVGRRDPTLIQGLPIAYHLLTTALNFITAAWLCDEIKGSKDTTEGGLEVQRKLVESLNSATRRIEQVWMELHDELDSAREEIEHTDLDHGPQCSSLASDQNRAEFWDGQSVVVLEGLHHSDSDKHIDVISFLRDMSTKMCNGWRKGRIARLDVTGGVFDDLRRTSDDEKDEDKQSRASVKRSHCPSEGTEDIQSSKRGKGSL